MDTNMMIGLRSFTIMANKRISGVNTGLYGYTGLYGLLDLKREAIDTNLSTLIIPNR